MNSVTALMTTRSIVNPQKHSQVQHPNHELCHRDDDVTQHRESPKAFSSPTFGQTKSTLQMLEVTVVMMTSAIPYNAAAP
jgi:hypothetical protein